MVVLLDQTTFATTKLIFLSIFKTKVNTLAFNYPKIKEALNLLSKQFHNIQWYVSLQNGFELDCGYVFENKQVG